MPRPSKVKVGDVFGRLTVVSKTNERCQGQIKWECECSCGRGKRVLVVGYSLLRGGSQSCGCILEEMLAAGHLLNASKKAADKTRFGKDTPRRKWTFSSWKSMIRRCSNPKSKDYARYGAKGITVDPNWLGREGFACFQEQLGDRPEGTTLDRIDPNGNYSVANCRWSTPTEQMRNRLMTVKIVYEGVERSLAEWADLYNLSYKVVYNRHARNMPLDRLFLPKKRYTKKC